MDLMLMRAFQRQVLVQCEYILFATQDLDRALKAHNTRYTFYAVQNLLGAAANVSKTLWGQGGKFTAKRRPLRDSIGVSDTSPLRDVTMRNNFEHFDERIDKWWRKSKGHNIVHMNIMPVTGIAGTDDIDRFRQLDPHTMEVIFWSQRFDLRAIVAETQRILPKLRQELDKPHWQRRT
jgi:hypothetical protein